MFFTKFQYTASSELKHNTNKWKSFAFSSILSEKKERRAGDNSNRIFYCTTPSMYTFISPKKFESIMHKSMIRVGCTTYNIQKVLNFININWCIGGGDNISYFKVSFMLMFSVHIFSSVKRWMELTRFLNVVSMVVSYTTLDFCCSCYCRIFFVLITFTTILAVCTWIMWIVDWVYGNVFDIYVYLNSI